MSTDNDDSNDLYQLAYSFFKEMGFEIKEQITLIGTSGKRYQFDMAIKTNLDDL
ncbi:MAG: hypothetical protein ACTSV6_04090 [Candidatus Heimdallarchaeota archaeon]